MQRQEKIGEKLNGGVVEMVDEREKKENQVMKMVTEGKEKYVGKENEHIDLERVKIWKVWGQVMVVSLKICVKRNIKDEGVRWKSRAIKKGQCLEWKNL